MTQTSQMKLHNLQTEFFDKLQIAFAELEDMLLEKTQAAQSDTASIVNSILQPQPQTEVRSHLPKLEISKFCGEALQ